MKKIQFKSYFFDFIAAMLKLHNLSMTVYMLLNAVLAVGILQSAIGGFLNLDAMSCAVIAIPIYLLSLVVMLSPIGEWFMRRQVGMVALQSCKQTPELARLETIFAKVLIRSKKINPNLEDDITLFLKEDDSLNAFAMGRKTIVIHTGTLSLPNDQIASILCHEMGHISHKDTDLRLAVTVGNVFVSLAFYLTRLVIAALNFIVNLFSRSMWMLQLVGMAFSLMAMVMNFFIGLGEKLWFFLGNLAINFASRKQELWADEFSVNCGCGKPLSLFLTHLLLDNPPDAGKDNILAAFMSTHPQIRMRLLALADLGVPIERADLLLKP